MSLTKKLTILLISAVLIITVVFPASSFWKKEGASTGVSFSELILFLIFFGIVLLVFRLILRKKKINEINSILKALEEISKGNFNIKTAVQSKDEIGQITQKINETGEKLKQLFIKFQESEKICKALINASPFCIKELDENGKLLFMSEAGLKEHFLKSVEDAKKWNYWKSIDPDYMDLVKNALVRAFKGESSEFEFRHVPGQSSREWDRGWTFPCKIENGEIKSALFVSADITEQKRKEGKKKKL